MSLDLESLKKQRETLKTQLRELEVQQRQAETSLKTLRQKEIRGKREVEALTTLIDLGEGKPEEPEKT